MPLTMQQEAFCQALPGCQWVATAAYLKAYPKASERSARTNAGRLLANADIQARIAEIQAEQRTRLEATADRVIEELARIAFADIRACYRPDGTLKPIHEWDDATAAAIAALETVETAGKDGAPALVTFKVTRQRKDKALELLCRHLGLLNDKLSVTTPPGSGLDVSRIPDAIKRTLLDALRAARA
jgi:phage terminase small subunit